MNRPLAGPWRRDGVTLALIVGPKFGALVRIEAAQIVGEGFDRRIGRHGSSPVGISLTDDCERRQVILHAGNIFGPVDRGLDRFDLIVPELEGLDPCGGGTFRLPPRQIRPNALAPTA